MGSEMNKKERVAYSVGFLVSLIAHLLSAVILIVVLERQSAAALKPSQVFTVTLEGGEVLGGHSQVPEKTEQKKRVLPHTPEETAEPNAEDTAKKEPEEKKEITNPSVVEDPEKSKKEKERLLAEEAKKAEAEKKRAEAEKAKREREEQAKKQQEEKAKSEQERRARNKRLQDAVKKAKTRYQGESADAGGTGFGAARLGGKGMGGGTVRSIEYIAYLNQLRQYIKGGWHWLPGATRLQVHVSVTMLPDGAVRDARIMGSSGDSGFDESAVRAVYKASPLPVPPEGLYEEFSEFTIQFDSHE